MAVMTGTWRFLGKWEAGDAGAELSSSATRAVRQVSQIKRSYICPWFIYLCALYLFLGEVGLFITIIMLDNEVKNCVIRFYQFNNFFFIWNVFTTSLKIINKFLYQTCKN